MCGPVGGVAVSVSDDAQAVTPPAEKSAPPIKVLLIQVKEEQIPRPLRDEDPQVAVMSINMPRIVTAEDAEHIELVGIMPKSEAADNEWLRSVVLRVRQDVGPGKSVVVVADDATKISEAVREVVIGGCVTRENFRKMARSCVQRSAQAQKERRSA